MAYKVSSEPHVSDERGVGVALKWLMFGDCCHDVVLRIPLLQEGIDPKARCGTSGAGNWGRYG